MKIDFETPNLALFNRFVKVQVYRYWRNILQEWSRVKNISYVSCAAWNIFPINLLVNRLWSHEPKAMLVYFAHPRQTKQFLKVAFFQKVWFVFQISKKNIPNYYPELEIWIWCLLLLAGNLNFKFRIAFWNIFIFGIGRFKKHIALSEKTQPLLCGSIQTGRQIKDE